jgi:hypothetical protein
MSRASTTILTGKARKADPPSRVARACHTALLVLVVAAGCYVAYGFGRLWAEWRKTTQPIEVSTAAVIDPNVLTPGLPIDGPWSFAQLDWDIRSQIVSSADVFARFERFAVAPGEENDEQLPDVSPELVELAESFGAKAVNRSGNHVYRLDRPNLKAQLLVRIVSGAPKVVTLAAALPQDLDRWQFLELTPRGATGSSAAVLPQLLPLPLGARRDGGRFANDGQALLEFVSLDSTADELFSTWKAAGWDVRPNGAASVREFSYLCARGSEVIYAWSADPRDALKNLMLVRTPSGPDTNASDSP